MSQSNPEASPDAADEFSELLSLLGIEPGERISICSQKPGAKFTATVPVNRNDAVALASSTPYVERCEVWFGVNPVVVPSAYRGRGADEHVTRCSALFVDFDIKSGGVSDPEIAQTVAKGIAAALGQNPAAVVFTGHGGHAYWVLDADDEAWILDADSKRVAAQVVYRRFHRLGAAIAAQFGGTVDNVGQLSRILRVPGTYNRKNPDSPIPVTLHEYPFGASGPLSFSEVTEALDAYGVPELAEDAERSGVVVSEPAEWACGEHTTPYVVAMVDGWNFDMPRGRHGWLVSQSTRIACAHRLGRITADDYATARVALGDRFEWLLAHHGEPRKSTPGEVAGALAWGVQRAASLTDDQAAEELGGLINGDGPRDADRTDTDTSGVGPGGMFFDVAALLAGGTIAPPEPDYYRREDGRGLFYAGRVNVLLGDPECGKTWLALAAATDVLSSPGTRVVVIDLDHNGPGATVSRLIQLGVPPHVLSDVERFLYIAPEDRETAVGAVSALVHWRPHIAVVDSLGELLPMFGASSNDSDEFTNVNRRVLTPIAGSGAAVLCIDHLSKNAESRRFGAGGTTAKKRAIDGLAVRVSIAEPFVPGRGGASTLRVNKDRNGGVRAFATADKADREPLIGTFRLAPFTTLTRDGAVTGLVDWIEAPSAPADGEPASGTSLTRHAEKFDEHDELVDKIDGLRPPPTSANAAYKRLGGSRKAVLAAYKLWQLAEPGVRE